MVHLLGMNLKVLILWNTTNQIIKNKWKQWPSLAFFLCSLNATDWTKQTDRQKVVWYGRQHINIYFGLLLSNKLQSIVGQFSRWFQCHFCVLIAQRKLPTQNTGSSNIENVHVKWILKRDIFLCVSRFRDKSIAKFKLYFWKCARVEVRWRWMNWVEWNESKWTSYKRRIGWSISRVKQIMTRVRQRRMPIYFEHEWK